MGTISVVISRVFIMSSAVPDKISFESLTMLLADKLALLTPKQLKDLAEEWRLAQQIREYLEVESPGLKSPRDYWL